MKMREKPLTSVKSCEPKKSAEPIHSAPIRLRILEARVGIEPTHKGFADLSLTTWVPRLKMNAPKIGAVPRLSISAGAGNGIRTRDFDLGKVALYH